MTTVSRTVWVLGLASFFTDFSSEMIYPLLPLFLTSVLGATAIQLGVIEGIAEATASLFKVFSGILADRARRRKPLVVLGYGLSGVFRPLIGIAQSWHIVLLLRFADRVGKGIRTSPRDALIADVTVKENRGAAYGLHRAMDHAGAVVGPLVAGVLLTLPGITMREVFLLAAVPAVITLGVLVFGIKESERVVSPVAPALPQWRDGGRLGKKYRMFLLAVLLFSLGNSTDAFLLMRLSESGVQASWIAVLWSLHHVVKMLGNYYGGMLSDRMGRKRTLVAGWIYFSAIYLAFAWVESSSALMILFVLYGIYFGLVEPSERAFVADLVPPSLRGTAFGYFHLTVGVASLPASLIFGVIWHEWSVSAAFLFGSVLALMASAVMLNVQENPA
jgi:MFS family permease